MNKLAYFLSILLEDDVLVFEVLLEPVEDADAGSDLFLFAVLEGPEQGDIELVVPLEYPDSLFLGPLPVLVQVLNVVIADQVVVLPPDLAGKRPVLPQVPDDGVAFLGLLLLDLVVRLHGRDYLSR